MGACPRCAAETDGRSVFCGHCGAVQPIVSAGTPGLPAAAAEVAPAPSVPATWTPPPAPVAPPVAYAGPAGPPPGYPSHAPVPPRAPRPGTPRPAANRPKDPKVLLLVLGAVVVVVAAAVGGFLLLSRPNAANAATATATRTATPSGAATSAAAANGSTPAPSIPPGVTQLGVSIESAPSGSGDGLPLYADGSDCSYPAGVDGGGQTVTYEPAKALDGAADTAWRCPGAGGHTLQFRPGQYSAVTDLGLIPGYAKTDPATGADRFLDNHTVTQAVWRLYTGATWYQFVQDIPNPTAQMAWIHLPQAMKVERASLTVTATGNSGSRVDSTPISTVAMWGNYVPGADE
jgi:hypothetical protein